MRHKKFWIDVLFLLILIGAFIFGVAHVATGYMSLRTIHIIVGCAFFIVIVLHFAVNVPGWTKAAKVLFKEGVRTWKQTAYVIDLLLLLIWVAVLVTGMVHMNQTNNMPMISDTMSKGAIMDMRPGAMDAASQLTMNIHLTLTIIGTILIGLHIFQHFAQIKSYLGISRLTSRSGKDLDD